MLYSNFHKFLSSTCNFTVTLKPGLGVTQVHRNRHVSIRHVWLPINVHSNNGPIWYHFRDKRWFQSKITIFPHPVYFAPPLTRFPFDLDIGAKKQEWRRYYGWSKSSKIGLAVWTQYRRVTDRQTDGQTPHDSKDRCYAQRRAGNQFQHPSEPAGLLSYIFFTIGNSLCVYIGLTSKW